MNIDTLLEITLNGNCQYGNKIFLLHSNAVDICKWTLALNDNSKTFINLAIRSSNDENVKLIIIPIEHIHIKEIDTKKDETTCARQDRCPICSLFHVLNNFNENCPRVRHFNYNCAILWKNHIRQLLRVVPFLSIPLIIDIIIVFIANTFSIKIIYNFELHDRPRTLSRINWQMQNISLINTILDSIEQYAKDTYVKSLIECKLGIEEKKIQSTLDMQCKSEIEIGFLHFQAQIFRLFTEFVSASLCKIYYDNVAKKK